MTLGDVINRLNGLNGDRNDVTKDQALVFIRLAYEAGGKEREETIALKDRTIRQLQETIHAYVLDCRALLDTRDKLQAENVSLRAWCTSFLLNLRADYGYTCDHGEVPDVDNCWVCSADALEATASSQTAGTDTAPPPASSPPQAPPKSSP